jgi:integrase
MAAAEPIRSKRTVRKMAEYCLKGGSRRNYVLITLGVYTALRISDLLPLTWGSVYDFERKKFKKYLEVTEKKTGKRRAILLNGFILDILKGYFHSLLPDKRGAKAHIFTNNRRQAAPISRVQAWKIVRQAAEAVGVEGHISCHSLRKTFGYHAWQKNVPVAVIMDVFNHSSFTVTRRYLGIDQDDRDRLHKNIARLLQGNRAGIKRRP